MRPVFTTLLGTGFISIALIIGCAGHGSFLSSPGSLSPLANPRLVSLGFHVPTQDNGDLEVLGQEYPSPGIYLTWVYVSSQDRIATFRNAGVKSMYYTMQTRVADNVMGKQATYFAKLGTPSSSNVNYAHDCNGTVLTSHVVSGLYLTQTDNTNVRKAYEQVYIDPAVSPSPDAYFFDAAGNLNDMPAAPCHYNQQTWITGPVAGTIAALAAYVPAPEANIVYNGLTFVDEAHSAPAPEIALNAVTGVIGGRGEECYIRNSSTMPYDGPAVWKAFENTELKMGADQKLFVCQPNDLMVDPASTPGMNHRMFAYASYLLTYVDDGLNPNHNTVYWYYSAKGKTGARVMPEAQLVPQSPSSPQPSDISALGIGPGTNVFVREYQSCSVNAVHIGECLVVVNVDAAAQPTPAIMQGYANGKRLVLHGGAWPDGGSVTEDSPGGPPTLAPQTGYILFK